MDKITRILFRGITILLVTCETVYLYSQQIQSVLLNNDILAVRAEGIAFLGSGITENDAKTLAINDAKRNALEQAGTYLESHTTVLNYQLVKDEIITYTGGLLKVTIVNEKRIIVNNMFAYQVEIGATIDIKLLNERIKEIRSDYYLKGQLEYERERNRQLEAYITELQTSANTITKSEVSAVLNKLSASDWNDNAQYVEDLHAKIGYFTKAIELDPTFINAYINRSLTYINLGRWNDKASYYEEAILDCNKAIELDPVYANAYVLRGYAYVGLDRHAEAIQDFDVAIELDPQNVEAYLGRGSVYWELGKYTDTMEVYNKAIELDPLYCRSYLKRSLVYGALKSFEEAIWDCNKAIELDPQNVEAYLYRGTFYGFLGRSVEGVRDLNKVKALDPLYYEKYLQGIKEVVK